MKILRPVLALAATIFFVSCQAAGNLIQAPFNLVGRALQPIGRTVGLSSENTRTPGDMTIEAREVREALASGERIHAVEKPADGVVAAR
jgi:hypothetical protein